MRRALPYKIAPILLFAATASGATPYPAGNEVSMSTLVNKFARSRLIVPVTLSAMLAVPASIVQAQTHLYNLNGSYADAFGGPALVSDGGVLGATDYTFGANQGLSLSNVLTGGTYSIAFSAELDQTAGYRKLIDYKNQGSDAGTYNLSGFANFYPDATGPGVVYSPGDFATTVLTRDGTTNLVTEYVDGAFQFSFTDAIGDALFTGPNSIARFFEDDNVTGLREASSGAVNYIAIYDTDLSAQQVANLDPQGPVSSAPEPATLTLFATGLVGIVGIVRRRRK